uniref:Uncharacterized protein n=1 Tax=Nelumbo nucifera TaxID=4432 RepID=A0A822ZII1_NELNU|nr:TPA_asm: hypothetical protein HUJ06_004154 [Nelumbo nucifera]
MREDEGKCAIRVAVPESVVKRVLRSVVIVLLDGDKTRKSPGSSQVKPLNIGNFNTGDVAESLHNIGTLSAINNERTLARNVSMIPRLTLSWSGRMAILRLHVIGISTDLLEDLDHDRCLLNALRGVTNHERNLGNVLNTMAACKDKSSWEKTCVHCDTCCQRHPVQRNEYHHLEHGGYELRHDSAEV